MFRLKFPAAMALIVAAPAFAADRDDQLWVSATASVNVSKTVVLSVDGIARYTDDAGHLGQVLVRPSIGYKLGKNTTAAIGYAYSDTDPVGPARSQEHRFWQHLTYRIAGDGKALTVTGRTRLEQRWVEGRGDMGWRARQQVKATAPLSGKTRVFYWSEVFFNLKDTSWGSRSGLDRWRNSVGVSVPVNKVLTIEPGYVHQWIVARGDDRLHNIASVTLNAKF